MRSQKKAVITGSGSYIPERKITNGDFAANAFYDRDGARLGKSNSEIIRQFELITGIRERRYVTDGLVASDMAHFAGRAALGSAAIDPETLDHIIVAHNFGDIRADSRRSEMVPSLAARVKHHLGIMNPQTICYDLPFGCAGWLEALIHADGYIRSGKAAHILVIGTETLSRVCDPHDRDSMIFADGAGAVVLSAVDERGNDGVLAHLTRSYTGDQAYLLQMGRSSNPAYPDDMLFIKMQGRKLYEQALKLVPLLISDCLAKCGLAIGDIDQVLIHQANHKMDEAIVKELFARYGLSEVPGHIMPMTIAWLGNSSVATLPTLYDLLAKGAIPNHRLIPGRTIVFAAVGAGLNMNALVYKIPENNRK
jgi:3-oxoacyl-[acyl-carrier-protein] synthase-3